MISKILSEGTFSRVVAYIVLVTLTVISGGTWSYTNSCHKLNKSHHEKTCFLHMRKKAQISCRVTLVFANAKCRFSHNVAVMSCYVS